MKYSLSQINKALQATNLTQEQEEAFKENLRKQTVLTMKDLTQALDDIPPYYKQELQKVQVREDHLYVSLKNGLNYKFKIVNNCDVMSITSKGIFSLESFTHYISFRGKEKNQVA